MYFVLKIFEKKKAKFQYKMYIRTCKHIVCLWSQFEKLSRDGLVEALFLRFCDIIGLHVKWVRPFTMTKFWLSITQSILKACKCSSLNVSYFSKRKF